jgi:hypothetical protein
MGPEFPIMGPEFPIIIPGGMGGNGGGCITGPFIIDPPGGQMNPVIMEGAAGGAGKESGPAGFSLYLGISALFSSSDTSSSGWMSRTVLLEQKSTFFTTVAVDVEGEATLADESDGPTPGAEGVFGWE